MQSRLSLGGRTAVVAGVLATTALFAQQQDEKVVPVHQEPRHHMVLDNAVTRVLDIQIPPGDTTLFHTHSNPILYVNMSSSQTRSQTFGREWSGEGAAAGAKPAPAAPAPASTPAVFGRMNSVTNYSTQPLTHRVNNIGTSVFRLIGIINRTDGDASTDPSADFAAKPEVDNHWLRGYRWPLDTTPTPQHTHANPVVIVLVRGRAVVTAAKDLPLDTLGAFSFIEGGVAHSIKGVSGNGVEPNQVDEIEVRKPRC